MLLVGRLGMSPEFFFEIKCPVLVIFWAILKWFVPMMWVKIRGSWGWRCCSFWTNRSHCPSAWFPRSAATNHRSGVTVLGTAGCFFYMGFSIFRAVDTQVGRLYIVCRFHNFTFNRILIFAARSDWNSSCYLKVLVADADKVKEAEIDVLQSLHGMTESPGTYVEICPRVIATQWVSEWCLKNPRHLQRTKPQMVQSWRETLW